MPALGGLTSGAAPHPEEQLEEEASGEGAVLTSNPSTTGIIGVLGLGSAITLVENAAASAAEKGNVDFGQTGWSFAASLSIALRRADCRCVIELRERQAFLLIAAEALLDFGAPSHRIEADLQHAARTLGVTAQFMHSPAVVIASFGSVVCPTQHFFFNTATDPCFPVCSRRLRRRLTTSSSLEGDSTWERSAELLGNRSRDTS